MVGSFQRLGVLVLLDFLTDLAVSVNGVFNSKR